MGKRHTAYGAGPSLDPVTTGTGGWFFWSLVVLACLAALVGFSIVTVDYVQNRNYRNFVTTNQVNANLLSDVAQLNYVLAIDQLKAAAYVLVSTKYNATASFGNVTTPVGDILLGTNILANMNIFTGQETNDSVSVSNLITAKCALLPASLKVGCAPVVPCNYTFGSISTVTLAVTLLETIELVAESAYPVVVGLINDPVAASLVGQLLVMESNHAAYWATLLGTSPSPASLVTLKNQNQVLCTLSAYLYDAATCVPFSLRQFC